MRKVSLLLVLLAALCTGAFAYAQEMPVFCGTLAEADCAILTSAENPSIDVTSATFTINLNLNATNIPDTGFSSLAFSLVGDGSYSVDPAAAAAAESMASAAMADPDPTAMLQNITTLLNGVDAEITLTLNLPQEFAAMAAQGGGQPLPTTITLEAVLVDGIAYLNFDQLAGLAPGLPTGWQGINLTEIIGMMGPDIAEMAQQGGENPFASGGEMAAMFENFDTAAMSEFVTITRLADANVSGAPVAVFQSNVNLGAFFSSQLFRDIMAQSMAGQPMPDQSEFDQMAAAMSNSTLSMTRYIGTADSFTYQTDTTLNLNIDPAAIDPSMAGSQPMTVAFNMSIVHGNINAAPPITAPAGATVVSTQELMSGMMGGAMPPDAMSGMNDPMMPMVTEQPAG